MMRIEVTYAEEYRGARITRVVEAHSFDAAVIKAGRELVRIGRLSDEDGLPLPVSLRRLT